MNFIASTNKVMKSIEPTRILIVEDEQTVAADLERTLTRFGYAVVGLVKDVYCQDEAAR